MPHGGWWRIAGALAAGAALLAGCETAPIPYKTAAGERGRLELPLDGPYDATIHSYFTGSLRARIVARPRGDGFVAVSRTGAAWPLIGGVRGFFAPLVLSGLFPGGSILVWESQITTGEGDTAYGRIGAGRAFSVPTLLWSPEEPVELLYSGRRLALMTLEPAAGDPPPAADTYLGVAAGVERVLRERLFDPALADSAGVRRYVARVRESARIARDDLEFAFGAEIARRNSPIFSQLLLLRELDSGIDTALGSKPGVRESLVTGAVSSRDNIGVVRADAFISGPDVDRVMRAVLSGAPEGLVIDLRAARVGDLSALRVAAWLLPAETAAGTAVLPAAPGAGGRVAVEVAEDPARLRVAIERDGPATIVIDPVPAPYTGPVIVLTSEVTASSAEALAHLLQSTGRARVVGQRTAGKMLIPERTPVGHGWVLQLPAFDYLAADGRRIEGRGVRPDVRTDPEDTARVGRQLIREAARAPQPASPLATLTP